MKRKFRVKTLKDGRATLNLGCGTRMRWDWNNIDFSPYAHLAHHKNVAKFLAKIGFLSKDRFEKLSRVDPEIIIADLRKGIPFDDDTFDVVYHSHLLEHIDRDLVPDFLKECRRVLKNNGVLRIVVPDLEYIIRQYVETVEALEHGDESALCRHQKVIFELLDQMVRKEPVGTMQQRPVIRFIERLFRGDAAEVGELHRWLYDKYSLHDLLSKVGFRDIQVQGPFTSVIDDWNSFYLDTNEDGSVYKPGSLYMEAIK